MKRPGTAALVNLARLQSRFLKFEVRADAGLRGGDFMEIIVGNKRGQLLGQLEYSLAWQMYVFSPSAGTIWSSDCLADIGKALEILK